MRSTWAYGLLLAALLSWASLLHLHDPVESAVYPKCLVKQSTGLDCPGCGSSRCVRAMSHLEFKEAFLYNPLAFVAFPGLVIYALGMLFGWWKRLPSSWMPRLLRKHGALAVLLIVLVFTLLRNLW